VNGSAHQRLLGKVGAPGAVFAQTILTMKSGAFDLKVLP
jgi:hypothetical protein